MKIAHFVSSIDISTGGPARSVTHLIKSLLNLNSNYTISLFTVKSNYPIILKFNTNKGSVIFSKKKSSFLNKIFTDSELEGYKMFHIHGIWQPITYQIVKNAINNNIPYIITPRGMLEPWSLLQGRFKKKLVLKLFQLKHLKNSSCIHATAFSEVESIKNLGIKKPIALIPNGINLNEFPNVIPIKEKVSRKILFLSRIHVKKGIENLIEAWRLIEDNLKKDWIIEIVGNGEKEYTNELKERIISVNLENSITVKDPVFGDEKLRLFREASLFVLPTYSENFGIVIAEALASYTPVITTKGAPWRDLETYKCGWWIDIGVEPLKKALEKAITEEDEGMLNMSKNGRVLVEEKYSMKSVALKMSELYQWILTNKNKPKFIY